MMQINKKIKPVGLALVLLFLFSMGGARAARQNRETPVVRAVREVGPAVVNISSEYVVSRPNPFGMRPNPFVDNFFKDFFDRGLERQYKRNSLGSGVIIDGRRGFILTNNHVIEQSGKVTVTLRDERVFEAEIVGADPDSDLAVLRIDTHERLPAIEMGNSDDLMIGETVIAIGNPFGFSHTVTTGVISAVDRSIRTDDRVFHDFIQTDASINPGNSGGPLLNINGELIGVNAAIYEKAQGIGFAIPINQAKRVVADLIQYGEVIQAWVGLVVQHLDERMRNYLGVPGTGGVLIQTIEAGSPAARTGLAEGDILMGIGRKKIADVSEYLLALRGIAPGEKITLHLWRKQRELQIELTAGRFPLEKALDLARSLLGVEVKAISPDLRQRYHIYPEQGVVITGLERDSQLSKIGARPGDVIRQMDDAPIRDLADFQKAVVKYRNKPSVVVLVQRMDRAYYITLKLH